MLIVRHPQAVLNVIRQHADDAAGLYAARTALTVAPHVRLHHLRRCDDRLDAHLDGLAVAADAGWAACEAELESVSTGNVFAAGVRAIEDKDPARLDRIFALAEAVPEVESGLISAFGWSEASHLRGVVANLLTSKSAFRRRIGMAACAAHRVEPGKSVWEASTSDAKLYSQALRTVGELGRIGGVRACVAALDADDPATRFWAAWSGVLLGDRNRAMAVLNRTAVEPGPYRSAAFRLVMQVVQDEAAHDLLAPLARDPKSVRWAIEGAGLTGDGHYVPWLIEQMRDDALCRLAGEAITLITGADYVRLDLERKPPESGTSGPDDDADDPVVAMDDDDGLPWPDRARVESWWAENHDQFEPGVRRFLGESVTRENCQAVLRSGFQRQRILAALYLCLLEPGTVLFNTSAPARRQQQLVARIDG